MFFLNQEPERCDAQVWSTMPDHLRLRNTDSDWAKANKGGEQLHSFIEGPAMDAQGNLYVTDIPYGRIFRISAQKDWELLVQYDGEPNGLKVLRDGSLLIADYRRGLLRCDPLAKVVEPVLARRNAQSFKGLNDLYVTRDESQVYFTDQGQTGLHDPTGAVYRYGLKTGRLDCLMNNVPSPNGIVVDEDRSVLFVAATRDNAVWRAPLQADGSVSKTGRFCVLFGTSGPDGLALDQQGRLYVAHASLGRVFVFEANGECCRILRSVTGNTVTNLCFANARCDTVLITESATGTVLHAAVGAAEDNFQQPEK